MEKEIEINLNNNDSSDENQYKEIFTTKNGFIVEMLVPSRSNESIDLIDAIYLYLSNRYI